MRFGKKKAFSRIVFPESHNDICSSDVKIELTNIGVIANKYIGSMSRAYENIVLDRYIIMPDHIHFIVFIKPQSTNERYRGTSLFSVVHALKRLINKEVGYNIWQESFYERVIRDKDELYHARKYILDNPIRWYYKTKR